MSNVADDLKAGFSSLSLDEALQLPVSTLLGVTNSAAAALKRTGVETIFDLGSSWLFANASAAMEIANGEPGLSPTHLLDDLPGGQPDDAASLALESLRGMSDEDAIAIKQALSLETIREFALWPPRRVAQRLLSEASGAGIDSEEAQAEALRPRLGEFPTERVYYDSLVMLGMTAGADQQPLTGTISLQPAVDEPAGFGLPAVGALVTLSQSWYAKGITLGHMLHSLALAPGEATRIAVVDWFRRTRTASSERVDETESLDNATTHSRAISEVQNAVADEMQSGGSMSSGWAKSKSSGKAGGFSIGGGLAGAVQGVAGALGFGGGSASSTQKSETRSVARSTSWSIGSRSVMAEMSQRVNDRTEQHSNSVRNRRASVVREDSQSENVQATTRIVANYNHMHALTVQYYEVVQIYRVLVQLHSAQRVLFLPFELLDFSGDNAAEVVARFRGQLLDAALSERVAALLLDDRGEVEIRAAVRMQVPPLFSDVIVGNLPTAVAAAPIVGAGGGGTPVSPVLPATTTTVLTAPGPVRRITSRGPVLDTVPGDVELVAVSFDGVRVDRVRFDQAGVPADNSTFAVPGTTFQIDLPGGLPLRNVAAIHLTKIDAAADSGTMTLHYRTATQQLTLPVPLDLAAGTAMQKVAFLAADPSNRREELMAHLQSNRAYYSQEVVGNLDAATLAMLLSRFTLNGKPLADQVEPNPLAVAGNYLVLRAPVEDDEAAGIEDPGTTWGDLLRQRSLTSEQHDDRLVPIPTGGVFAEAVLGRSNSAEKLDITRFWNWQDSPIPLQPTEIAPLSVGSRATAEDVRAGQLGTPVLNILSPGALPEPAGLTAALNTLASGSMFRDMSGLAGTQALAQAGSAGTLNAATEAGKLASANLKTVTDQAVAMGQAAADMWKVLQTKESGHGGAGGGSGSRSNISADGARINHGRDMDQRGVSDTGGGGSKATGSKSETQGSGGGGGNGAVSRELAFADTAATGVSPALLAGTTAALGGGGGAGAAPTPGVKDSGRSFIIEPADKLAWARARSFVPSATNPNKTGRTVLKVTTRPIPEGGRVRWSVPPDQAGRYSLAGGANVQSGLQADVTGIRPGRSKIDFDVFDANGTSIESQKYDLCIPQFVSVDANTGFDTVLERFGLEDFKADILAEAKATCDNLVSNGNVRTVWTMPPFSENVPSHLTNDLVTRADIGGDPSGSFVRMVLLGITRDENGNFEVGALIGPAVFDEIIDLFPGAMTDSNLTDIDESVVALIQAALTAPPATSTAEGALAVTVIGRILGTSLAHEILHALVGFMFPGPSSHTSASRDILNPAAYTFENLTGIQVIRSDFPAAGSFIDLGVEHIIRPRIDGTLAGLHDHFPVPPEFQ